MSSSKNMTLLTTPILATLTIVSLLVVSLLASLVSVAAMNLSGIKICVDPGHGGSDPGAVGYVVEKDINLAVALKLAELLKADKATVVLTRSGDYDVSLEERVAIANSAGCHVFVSIHSNAATSSSARGFEVYYYYGSSSGYQLASLIYNEVLALVSIPGRGVFEAGFYVLKYTYMPAVLVELGFVTNYYDAALLKDNASQWKYAYGILYGIQRYFGVPKHDPLATQSVYVNNVRYARYSTYARFVVDVSKPANFSVYYWSSPTWLAIYVKNAKLNSTIKSTWPATSSGWYYRNTGIPEIPTVYIQERTDGVLIVLATVKKYAYRYFTLSNPDRIVVDIYF